MTTHPAEGKIPYDTLMMMYNDLEEENAHIRAGLNLVCAERDRYVKVMDILLNMISPSPETNLPF